MKNEKIGQALKKYRKKNAMSVPDVALKLRTEYNRKVAEKTIYGWESNQAHPTTDMFLTLCEIYQINSLNEILDGENHEFAITANERRLIESYRQQPKLHYAIHKLLGIEEDKKP